MADLTFSPISAFFVALNALATVVIVYIVIQFLRKSKARRNIKGKGD